MNEQVSTSQLIKAGRALSLVIESRPGIKYSEAFRKLPLPQRKIISNAVKLKVWSSQYLTLRAQQALREELENSKKTPRVAEPVSRQKGVSKPSLPMKGVSVARIPIGRVVQEQRRYEQSKAEKQARLKAETEWTQENCRRYYQALQNSIENKGGAEDIGSVYSNTKSEQEAIAKFKKRLENRFHATDSGLPGNPTYRRR